MSQHPLCATTPESCGVHTGRLDKLFACAEALVACGQLDSCSIAVCRHGRLAGAATFGCDPQGRPVEQKSLFHLYSATKILVVSAAAHVHPQSPRSSLPQLIVELRRRWPSGG